MWKKVFYQDCVYVGEADGEFPICDRWRGEVELIVDFRYREFSLSMTNPSFIEI